MSNVYVSVTAFEYKEQSPWNFATITHVTFEPHYAFSTELSYERGIEEIEKLSKLFNRAVETNEHDTFIAHTITVPLG